MRGRTKPGARPTKRLEIPPWEYTAQWNRAFSAAFPSNCSSGANANEPLREALCHKLVATRIDRQVHKEIAPTGPNAELRSTPESQPFCPKQHRTRFRARVCCGTPGSQFATTHEDCVEGLDHDLRQKGRPRYLGDASISAGAAPVCSQA